MRIRNFVILAASVAFLAACSSDDQTASSEGVNVGDRAGMDGAAGAAGAGMGDVVPGSQQDLVVNVGDRVFYGFDRYDLSAEAQRTLELQAEWLKKYPNVRVTIEGHCDERGTREYNLALGERRASAVKNYLVALGIDSSRVTTISYGKERPAVLGADESAWSQNRRGVTVVE